jgi:hypothetical protein
MILRCSPRLTAQNWTPLSFLVSCDVGGHQALQLLLCERWCPGPGTFVRYSRPTDAESPAYDAAVLNDTKNFGDFPKECVAQADSKTQRVCADGRWSRGAVRLRLRALRRAGELRLRNHHRLLGQQELPPRSQFLDPQLRHVHWAMLPRVERLRWRRRRLRGDSRQSELRLPCDLRRRHSALPRLPLSTSRANSATYAAWRPFFALRSAGRPRHDRATYQTGWRPRCPAVG